MFFLDRTREGHHQCFLDRTRAGHCQRSSFIRQEGHRQSDKHWNHLKCNVTETSEGQYRVHNYELFLNDYTFTWALSPTLECLFKFRSNINVNSLRNDSSFLCGDVKWFVYFSPKVLWWMNAIRERLWFSTWCSSNLVQHLKPYAGLWPKEDIWKTSLAKLSFVLVNVHAFWHHFICLQKRNVALLLTLFNSFKTDFG